jgi:hypothetical protein
MAETFLVAHGYGVAIGGVELLNGDAVFQWS